MKTSEDYLRELEARRKARQAERQALLDNLTATQERCTTLLEETRAARAETRRVQAAADAMSRRIVELEAALAEKGSE